MAVCLCIVENDLFVQVMAGERMFNILASIEALEAHVFQISQLHGALDSALFLMSGLWQSQGGWFHPMCLPWACSLRVGSLESAACLSDDSA